MFKTVYLCTMTPNELTTVLAQNVGKVFDTPFKLILMEKVKALRSRLMKNTLDKTPADRKFFRSTIYLKLTETNSVPCEIPVNCKVYVTDKIPKPLRANSVLFDYVGSVDGYSSFRESGPGMIKFVNKGRYSKRTVGFIYSDDRLFFFENIPMIRLDFIPDDPMELAGFSCTQDSDLCDPWNTEYPLSKDVLATIIQVLSEELKLTLSQEDTVNVNPANDIQK